MTSFRSRLAPLVANGHLREGDRSELSHSSMLLSYGMLTSYIVTMYVTNYKSTGFTLFKSNSSPALAICRAQSGSRERAVIRSIYGHGICMESTTHVFHRNARCFPPCKSII